MTVSATLVWKFTTWITCLIMNNNCMQYCLNFIKSNKSAKIIWKFFVFFPPKGIYVKYWTGHALINTRKGHWHLEAKRNITQVQIKCWFLVYVKKYLSFGCRFSMDMGQNLNLIEKVWEISQKQWRHHFSTREILPEDSPTSSQKLTFETNGKTLPPPLLGPSGRASRMQPLPRAWFVQSVG